MEVRQCFVPRPGKVFVQGDYPALELHALSQVNYDLFGYSDMGDAINGGLDPHLAIAAELLELEYDEIKPRKKEPEIDHNRQVGKVANFGIPGGLGAAKLVLFARKGYGVTISEKDAKKLKKTWLGRWREMKQFFEFVGEMTNNDEGKAYFQHVRSNRWRGGSSYTSTCNSFFQGLGADAATAACFEVSERCYVRPESALYGARLVNFIHDELILEADEDRAPEAAIELGKVMAEVANIWMPGCPFEPIETLLMTRWSKKAEPLWRASDGRLHPWKPEDWVDGKPVKPESWKKDAAGRWVCLTS